MDRDSTFKTNEEGKKLKRRTYIVAAGLATILAGFLAIGVAQAAEPRNLELFGVPLKGAGRLQFRQALKQAGVVAKREDNNYWIDLYDASGVIDGAGDFEAGYVSASGSLAYAQYTFPGFMDIGLIGKVISMVSSKYGRPASQNGNMGLGPVNARWNMAQGMQIHVWRGWPDTTAYLKFQDTAAAAAMQAEIDAELKAQQSQKHKEQSKAF